MEVKDCEVQLQDTVYIDSAFLLNLVMDLYLLRLTVRMLGKTATNLRILMGSLTGALGYCMILCIPHVSYVCKVILGMLPVGILMIKITCQTAGIAELIRGLGYLYFLSFLMGGFIIFLRGKLAIFRIYENSIFLLALLGYGGYVILQKGLIIYQRNKQNCFCKVILEGDNGPIEIGALIDTGNGLIEPVSHKPVAVLDEDIWRNMRRWMRPEKYKMIPYHSLGKEHGILEGYEIDAMEVRGKAGKKQYEKVIVAVFKGSVSGKGNYKMILPSELSI